jgi:hypothetical protein
VLAPSVGGDRERGTYWPLAGLVAGGMIGGAVFGSILALVSFVLGFAGRIQLGLALGIIIAAATAALSHPAPWWVPQRTCQVSGHRLVAQHINAACFSWGLDLGLGFRTFVVTPAFYGIVGLAIVAPNPLWSVVIGVSYGSVRVLTIACFSRVVRKLQLKGYEATEPGLGLAKRLRVVVALATVLAPAAALAGRL